MSVAWRCAKLSLPGPALPQALLAQPCQPHLLLRVVMIVDLRGDLGCGLRVGLARHCGNDVDPVARTRLDRGIEQALHLCRQRFRLHGGRQGGNQDNRAWQYKIGRASCRARVGKYVKISVCAVLYKKKTKHTKTNK